MAYDLIESFLRYILPTEGLYITGQISHGNKGMHHTISNDISHMAQVIAAADQGPDDVYFALGTYAQGWHQVTGRNGKVQNRLRTAENIMRMKAMFIDIDLEYDTRKDGYRTKQEAWDALVNYCQLANLPMPLVIDSLNGFHCYWVLNRELPRDEWQPIADRFKQHLLENNFKIDPAVPADSARVLRPLGTHNKKDNQRYLVTAVNSGPAPIAVEVFAALPINGSLPNATSTTTTGTPDTTGLYEGLGVPILDKQDHLPAMLAEYATRPNALDVVTRCRQLQVTGMQRYPHWFGSMSVLAKCVDGLAAMHVLSQMGGSNYNPQQLDYLFQDQVEKDFPPTLCKTFEANNPGGCDGCPFHNAKGNQSPLHVREEETAATLTEDKGVPAFVSEVIAAGHLWGYRLVMDDGAFGIYEQEEVNEPGGTKYEWKLLTDRVVVPLHKVSPVFDPADAKNNHARLYWREIRPTGEVRELEVMTSVMANRATLETWLLDNSVKVAPSKQESFRYYMRSIWAGAMDLIPEHQEVDRVGWLQTKPTVSVDGHTSAGKHGFAIGEQILWENGVPTKLQATPDLLPDLGKYGFAGTLQEWKAPQTILNNPQQVWAQAISCMVLGSVMAEHMTAQDGLPMIYVYSKKSGLAKSTAMRYAMSAYGDPKRLMVTGGSGGARINAMIRANSLPTFHDEMTQSSLKEMEDLLMAQSQGVEKERMAPTGGVSRFSGRQWRSLAFANGNISFADQIAAMTTNEGPLLARIIEINLDHLPGYKADVGVKAIFDKASHNYGLAGRVMVQHILDNMEDCKDRMFTYQTEVNEEFGGDTVERMWLGAIAVLKFGCIVGNELGLHPYSWDELKEEAKRWVEDMRKHLTSVDEKEASTFSMLNSYIYRGLIICDQAGKPQGNERTKTQRVREDERPIARMDIKEKTLTVPVSIIRKFAHHYQLQYNKLIDSWEASGRVLEKGTNRRLTSHTDIVGASTSERCMIFDVSDQDAVAAAESPEAVSERLTALYGDLLSDSIHAQE